MSPKIEIVTSNIVDKYDFLLIPLSNAAAGTVGFGVWGGIAGMMVGIIDETLVKFKWTDSRYLSPAMQGVSSFATLTTSWSIRSIGGALNFGFSQMIISKDAKCANKITSPMQLSLQVGYIYGWKGIVSGIVLGGIEEMFIHYRIYDKHYISTAVSFISVAHLLKNKIGTLLNYYVRSGSKLDLMLTSLKKFEQTAPYFMSPCGIGLTPLPLGKHFSIIFQWNTEKAHIAHMI